MPIYVSERPYRSRLILTGANGMVGKMLAGKLAHIADEVVRTDLHLEPVGDGETGIECDLLNYEDLRAVFRGGGDVLHLGGQSLEAPFSAMKPNLDGVYNVYEAARQEGIRRILFASSSHVIGFHERTTQLDHTAEARPDCLYAATKLFGEGLARLYYHKFGIEGLILRFGSCFDEPKNERMLSSWLSVKDLVLLIERFVEAPHLGCPILYGMSDNSASWWDNSAVGYLGWRPQESADPWRASFVTREDTDPDDMERRLQGGPFATQPHPDDAHKLGVTSRSGQATMSKT